MQLGNFRDYVVNALGFAPGPVGATANAYSMGKAVNSASSGEGGGLPLPFIKGATGILGKFLSKANNTRKLNNILKKHLSSRQAQDCVPTANALMKDLKGLGVPADFLNIKAKNFDVMKIGDDVFSENGFHVGVEFGGRVFDKITGPAGMKKSEFLDKIARSVPDGRIRHLTDSIVNNRFPRR